MTEIHVGRLLRASTRACVAGCQIGQPFPDFGSMVTIPLENDVCIYGLVTDIHIDDDGLVRQLAALGEVPEEIIQDNRLNRNVPVELSVIFVGHARQEVISHRLPPFPPLSLDSMLTCTTAAIRKFTESGRFGYLRHILNAENVAVADLIAAHLLHAWQAHKEVHHQDWLNGAVREVIAQLRDDHAALSAVLGAVADAVPFEQSEEQRGGK